jgi:glycosyltransferase involved in cell wall biosynthesis
MEDQPNNVLVSVCCLTYNHAPFISECLDGILMQECNFEFEILINDDFSNDGTREIILEYQQKYPSIIKPIFQKDNLWSKGYRGFNQKFNFTRAKGCYIALCEGDDYWTDPNKLQKQVNFLINNNDYALVFHNAIILNNDNLNYTSVFSKNQNRDYSQEELFENWTVPTASMVFRKKIVNHDTYLSISKEKDLIFGDNLIQISSFLIGKVGCIIDNMSVYRIHDKGISKQLDKNSIKAMNRQTILFGKYFPELKKAVKKIIYNRNYVHLKIAIKAYNINEIFFFIFQILKQAIRLYP